MKEVQLLENPVMNDLYEKKVVIFNDEVNSMEHIAESLMKVCDKTEEEACVIMLEAHNFGKAICYTGSEEACEMVIEKLGSLNITVELQ